MRTSYRLLWDYIEGDERKRGFGELVEGLKLRGFEVEVLGKWGKIEWLDGGLKFGRIKRIEGVELLEGGVSLCEVDMGLEKSLRVMTRARNVRVGVYGCVALEGCMVRGEEVRVQRIRGYESEGVILSREELGLVREDVDDGGIWVMEGMEVGGSVKEYLLKKEAMGGLGWFKESEDYGLKIEGIVDRGDCLSVVGLAREVASLAGCRLLPPMVSKPMFFKGNGGEISDHWMRDWDSKRDVEIEEGACEDCLVYGYRKVRGIVVGESGGWLRGRLRELGVRSINDVVDVSQFVMYELGFPLHIFDLKKIKGEKVIVRRARVGEELECLDGVVRGLDEEVLVISDEEKVLAIAGVIGGKESGVTEETEDIWIECAYFDPVRIRRTVQKLRIETDASYRYSRGVDLENMEWGLYRCYDLIQKGMGDGGLELGGIWGGNFSRTIELDMDFFYSVSGLERCGVGEWEKWKKLLEGVGFEVGSVREEGLGLRVRVPSFRGDIERPIDLVEEMIRLYGYDGIGVRLRRLERRMEKPEVKKTKKGKVGAKIIWDQDWEGEEWVSDGLMNLGLSEVKNYSFMGGEEVREYGCEDYLVLRNFVGEGNEYLRRSLVFGLRRALEYNVNQGASGVGFYEVGSIFKKGEGGRIEEERNLGVILWGVAEGEGLWKEERGYDFYDLKGILEVLMGGQDFGLKDLGLGVMGSLFEEGKGCEVILGGDRIGVMGEFSELILGKILGKSGKWKAYYMELKVREILKGLKGKKVYKELRKYPSVYRDLVIMVDMGVRHGEIEGVIRKSAEHLMGMEVMDIYTGKHLPMGKKSVRYRLIFGDEGKTLDDGVVNGEYDRIVEGLRVGCGGEMRAI